ncbi:MAG: quinohemoprotein amine dehydrogenase subunit alpha [Gammaproteobacteria bacterium]
MLIGVEKYWKSLSAALVLGSAGFGVAQGAAAVSGQELVRSYCSGCHQEHAGKFERISDIRKTPEGWVMTLFRMRQVHGLNLGDDVRDAIVRYLADTQGLAPAESAAGRFALERRPNAQDIDLGPEMNVMCGRCHTLARVSLQRRDETEWRKLAHTHVGQWTSIEYSASGRDRPWWQIASGPLPAKLAALYPFSSSAWNDWKSRPAPDLSGSWVVVGHVPGGKDFYGTARIERDAGGDFKAHYQLADVSGFEMNGDSKAILYTGYEWRGSAQVGDRSLREVYAVSDDGNRITGRWFDADHAEDGGEWTAVREGRAAEVLAVFPQSLRAGTTTTVTVVGNRLGAATLPVSFGDGTSVTKVERSAQRIRAVVTVTAGAAPGMRAVSTGAAMGKLAVYAQIDQIDVVPGYAIARVGGGRVEPVSAQFEAKAFTRLPGGGLMALGPVSAEWISMPFDAEAKRTEDEKFAGHFDMRGRFLPNAAGPNPAREFSGDNLGNLTVVARATDGSRTVQGRGHLVVTVQRWITPPIY